jgi:microcystin-dependent protein
MVLNVPTGGASVERITKSDFLSDIYSNIFHTGMIVPFGGSTPPSGWVSCNGAALSTSTPPYVSLFETIGYQYGYSAGNFLVPNMTATTFVSTGSGTGTYLQYIIKI